MIDNPFFTLSAISLNISSQPPFAASFDTPALVPISMKLIFTFGMTPEAPCTSNLISYPF